MHSNHQQKCVGGVRATEVYKDRGKVVNSVCVCVCVVAEEKKEMWVWCWCDERCEDVVDVQAVLAGVSKFFSASPVLVQGCGQWEAVQGCGQWEAAGLKLELILK